MNETKQTAEEQLIDSLRSWGFDFEVFRAKAKQSIEAARGDLSEASGVMRQAFARSKAILFDLQPDEKPRNASPAETKKRPSDDYWLG